MPKVTGRAVYADDISFPDMLFAACFGAPFPAPEILSIDCSEARSLPGVRVVLTAKDIPGPNRYGELVKDQRYLVEDKVRYVGDPVAVVAAETKALSRQALEKIYVDYRKTSRGV